MYGAGRAELLLGAWVRQRGVRPSVVIVDKGAHPDAEGHRRVNPRDIAADATRSVEVLDVGSIDLYLLHRDDPAVPVDEIIDCLNELCRGKVIDAFGASNWSHGRIESANDYARRSKQVGFSASSPELNLCEPLRTWPLLEHRRPVWGRGARLVPRDSAPAIGLVAHGRRVFGWRVHA